MHRWAEVVARNDAGGCWVVMDGMVFDLELTLTLTRIRTRTRTPTLTLMYLSPLELLGTALRSHSVEDQPEVRVGARV